MGNIHLTQSNSLDVKHMADAMIFADLQGVIHGWNPGAETVFGFSSGEAVGKSLDLIFPESLRSVLWKEFRLTIDKGRTLNVRRPMFIRSLNRAGKTIYVDMCFAVVTDPGAKILGLVTLVNDATMRYQEERALCERLLQL